MSKREYLFTSESVTEGHPDKICDQISDAVLDAIMAREIEMGPDARGSVEDARVACETFITTGLVVVGGEIRTRAYVDVQKIVRELITEIGYDRAKYGFDAHTCGVVSCIHEQSTDIAIRIGALADSTLHARSLGCTPLHILVSPEYLKQWIWVF